MTAGSATLTALAAAVLATLVWWIAGKLGARDWLALGLFGLVLVLVILAGPLVRLP